MIDGLVKITGSLFVGGVGLFLIAIGSVIIMILLEEIRKRY